MAEEQIDRLTVEVESIGGDDKAIADIRKQLEKLGRVDLSGTIRQLGDLRTALGYLGTVDDNVKSMLDNMVKLGMKASSVSAVKRQMEGVATAAKDAEKTIKDAHDAYEKWAAGKPSISFNSGKNADYERLIRAWEKSDEAARADGARIGAKNAAKRKAAADWYDTHAGSKSYEVEMLKGRKFNPDESFVPLGDIITKAKKEFFGMGDAAKQAGNKAENALDKASQSAQKAHKSTSKLADAFVRIVRFKIVAAVLQKTIHAAKEGVTALGEFDSEFKDTLNT